MFLNSSIFRNWTPRIRAFLRGVRWKFSNQNEKITLSLLLVLLSACLMTCPLLSQNWKILSGERVNESGQSVSSREARKYPGSIIQKDQAHMACRQLEQSNRFGRFLTGLVEPT